MLIISSVLVFFISVAFFVLFISRSYLKNVVEGVCIFLAVIGLNCTCLAVCLYYAEFGGSSYLLNKYFFISQEFLDVFRGFHATIFEIGDLLVAARLLFVIGIYCFGTIVIDRRLSFRKDFVLLIPVVIIGMNISYIYVKLIKIFKTISAPISRTITIFDWITKICMIPAIAVILFRLIRYYKSSHNITLRKNTLLFFGGLTSICIEYALILDLTPSSSANVYSNSFLIAFMSQLVHNALTGSQFFFLYLIAIALITISFLVVIISSIGIMRWQNYKKVSSRIVNKSIPVTNVQNLIPFLHSFKNQLVSLTQFEQMINLENFESTFPIIQSITKEMSQTIDNLYGNSREIKLNIVLSNVNQCIQHAIETVNSTKDIEIRFNNSEPAFAMIDPEYIQHALENIIYNAVDACMFRDNPLIQISIQKKRRFLGIVISDNGIGISKENLKKITEPFFSTKNRSHSWGMGLNHVNKIINAHNGHIRFNSEENVGTDVLILLPTGR